MQYLEHNNFSDINVVLSNVVLRAIVEWNMVFRDMFVIVFSVTFKPTILINYTQLFSTIRSSSNTIIIMIFIFFSFIFWYFHSQFFNKICVLCIQDNITLNSIAGHWLCFSYWENIKWWFCLIAEKILRFDYFVMRAISSH